MPGVASWGRLGKFVGSGPVGASLPQGIFPSFRGVPLALHGFFDPIWGVFYAVQCCFVELPRFITC